MPGLEQLKRFSEDAAKLGNEFAIREKKGETIVRVPFPENISEEDDSDDFVLGMPLPFDSEADVSNDEFEREALEEDDSPTVDSSLDYSAFPELDSILNPEPAETADFSDFPELAEILSPEPETTADPLADFFEDTASGDEPLAGADTGLEELSDMGAFDLPDFDSLDAATEPIDLSLDSLDLPSDSTEGALDSFGFAPETNDLVSDDLASDSLDFSPDSLGLDSGAVESSLEDSPASAETPAAADTGLEELSDMGAFDLPDFDSLDAATEPIDLSSDSFDPAADSHPDDFADSLPEIETPDDELPGEAVSGGTEDGAAVDFGSQEPVEVDSSVAAETVSDDGFPSAAIPGDEDDEPVEGFDPETHEVFDAPDNPFDGVESPPDENLDDFDIPGFSDQAAGMVMAKTRRPSAAGQDGKKEKNTLSDKEYETFLKNLRGYPLNLRIELEKFIVGDEFKDDVVFEVVQKVIKKTSARQLATHLEKLLDVSIPVPREFERRTATQYEEYKKSAEYQLKNRVLPIAILSVMAACILYFAFLFGKNFIYEPLKANSLYKEGYALLEEGAYPQSEMKFDEALTYQQQKRWFFTYAEGYRRHKQYERARMMYRAGLQRFKQDKQMGLDYAEMELYDLRNFENAETVVRREVLDYHINDPDGMLLLGDIFLEWGDERDPAKYEEAKAVFNDLLQIYGQEDLYLARMMRYYIRVDDLRNVLQMKEYFYPKKKALDGQDLIELSGYLLDKISGNIAPADEYLLSSIEDVRELLERAVEAVPEEPESLYNMGLYFVNSNSATQAQDWLSAALAAFENAEYKPRKRLLRQLNAYRLLGDLDVENREYLSAEEKYRTGVSLFEKEAKAGLVGDRNVGKLYASLADINYMIIGDYDEALRNYTIAANTQYGTPSVYYKMGYINYSQKKYGEALNLFVRTADKLPYDTHVLYSLGNVLSVRGDNFAAQGYYQRLMNILEQQRVKYEILFPQVNDEHKEIVEMYKLGANNLGVTLYRLSRQTGNSAMNAEALTNFTASLRASDALERDQETLVRKEGSNLAEQNIRYMTMSLPTFEPAIYADIPALLEGEYLPQ